MVYDMSHSREKAQPRPPAKAVKVKNRPSEAPSFDPDELSRRLYLVLADQNAQAERRRRAKIEAIDRRAREARSAATKKTEGEASSSRAPPEALATKSQTSKPNPLRGATQMQSASQASSAAVTEEPATYHHIPQEAAKQFARTTTAGGMRDTGLVHRLSRRAPKSQPDGASPGRPLAGESTRAPFDQARFLRLVQSQRERLLERNQIQRSRIEEEEEAMPEPEEGRDQNPARHTFEGAFGPRKTDPQQQDAARRNSTGNLLEGEGENRNSAIVLEPPPLVAGEESPEEPSMPHEHHRVDWTQSDEAVNKPKLLLSPLLRRADSIWTLKGRLGSTNRHNRDEIAPAPLEKPDLSQPPEGPKSPRANFFARFKR